MTQIVDEDNDTDNDQMRIASMQVMVDLREAIDMLIDENVKVLRNRNYITLEQKY